jgi:hypothetical protein
MSDEVYNLLDELAARGRRLRGQLPGDYKPMVLDEPVSNGLARLRGWLIDSLPADDEPLRWEEESG